MNVCKKILLISVIAFVVSIILGNVFNILNFYIGKYIAMAILYIAVGIGITTLIGYFITKRNSSEKMPMWITALIGIIIAIVLMNTITSVIEYNREERDKVNIAEESKYATIEKCINNYKLADDENTIKNKKIIIVDEDNYGRYFVKINYDKYFYNDNTWKNCVAQIIIYDVKEDGTSKTDDRSVELFGITGVVKGNENTEDEMKEEYNWNEAIK